MKRRNFIKKTAAASLLGTTSMAAASAKPAEVEKGNEYYEIRTYELVSKEKQGALEDYFQRALIPALKRNGAGAIGVFEDLEASDAPKCYLLITYPKLKTFTKLAAALAKDSVYQLASQDYNQIKKDDKIYHRVHTSLLEAFDSIPQMILPQGERILELRIYESYSEDSHRRKVMMFDDEELALFYKTGLHPVFFGKALIGPSLPNLTYMLTFKDKEERDANWKTFVGHPDWDAMKNKPIYADSVSKVTNFFLKPRPYSEV